MGKLFWISSITLFGSIVLCLWTVAEYLTNGMTGMFNRKHWQKNWIDRHAYSLFWVSLLVAISSGTGLIFSLIEYGF